MENSIQKAKELFNKKKYKSASELFLENKNYYEAGLCFMLQRNFEKAQEYFLKDEKNKFATSFGIFVLEVINQNVKTTPSYLQIRAFFEIYINLFIENKMLKEAQDLINTFPTLSRLNGEIYKFIARVLYANNYYDLSLSFIKKVEDCGFTDPEARQIGAEIYFEKRDYKNSLIQIEKVLETIPEYYPSLKLQQKIFEKNLK